MSDRHLVVTLVAAALLSACASGTARQETVRVLWRAGYAEAFQGGALEERRARSTQGLLPVTIYRPAGAGPFPFVVLLHGCGGLHREAMWTSWVEPWADVLRAHGVGSAVVDSFAPRGVEQVCTGNVAAWAARRADVKLVVYPHAPHTFDMPLPDRTVLGMRLGHDAQAATDARRQVIAFLATHGVH